MTLNFMSPFVCGFYSTNTVGLLFQGFCINNQTQIKNTVFLGCKTRICGGLTFPNAVSAGWLQDLRKHSLEHTEVLELCIPRDDSIIYSIAVRWSLLFLRLSFNSCIVLLIFTLVFLFICFIACFINGYGPCYY